MNPSLFSLCSLEAALWRRFLWEFRRESSTCHHVRQFSTKANPTIDAIDMRTAFTVRCFGSTLKIARRVIPAIMQPKIKRKMTKDGRQHVFFHFFLPVRQQMVLPISYIPSTQKILTMTVTAYEFLMFNLCFQEVHWTFIPSSSPTHRHEGGGRKSYPAYLQS